MSTRLLQGGNGGDFVVQWSDDSFGGAKTNALTVAHDTAKVTVGDGSVPAGFPGNMWNDYWDKAAADGAAATTTAEHTFFRAPQALTIAAVRYIPDATLTSSDTTYATLTVSVRNADGTNQQTVASVTTKTSGGGGSGNWSQWVAVPLTLQAANATLAKGQILTISIAKASTGVVVPAGSLQVDFQNL